MFSSLKFRFFILNFFTLLVLFINGFQQLSQHRKASNLQYAIQGFMHSLIAFLLSKSILLPLNPLLPQLRPGVEHHFFHSLRTGIAENLSVRKLAALSFLGPSLLMIGSLTAADIIDTGLLGWNRVIGILSFFFGTTFSLVSLTLLLSLSLDICERDYQAPGHHAMKLCGYTAISCLNALMLHAVILSLQGDGKENSIPLGESLGLSAPIAIFSLAAYRITGVNARPTRYMNIADPNPAPDQEA